MKKHPSKKRPYNAQFRNHVRRMCNELRTLFFAGEYEMDVCWCNEEKESPTRDAGRVIASIDMDARYLNFTVHIGPAVFEMWNANDDYRVGRAIVHEFSHLLVDPVFHNMSKELGRDRWEEANEIRERQVQRVANVIWALMPAKVWKRKVKKDGASNKLHKHKRR